MDSCNCPSDQPPENQSTPLSLSLEILDALGKAGMAIVPRTPTPTMIDAAAQVLEGDGALASAVYKAMLEAAD